MPDILETISGSIDENLLGKLESGEGVLSKSDIHEQTDREAVDATLAEQARLLDITHDSIILRHLDGTISYFNRGAERQYGWARAEVLGAVSHSLFKTQFPEPLAEIESKLAHEGEWEGELTHTKRDGSQIIVASRWVLERDLEGRALSVLEINNDITHRKRAEETRRRKEQYFQLLVQGVQDYAIFVIDLEGYVRSWNLGAERIKGYKEAEIIGQHFSIFFTPGDIASGRPELELQMTETDGRYDEENWRVRKDGSWFWASIVTTAVHDDLGTPIGFAKIIRDVTGRRRAEEVAEVKALEEHTAQLQAANTELETFSYSVSHDLRAPLRAIDGFSRILIEDYADHLPAEAREYLGSIRTNAQQMGRMVDALLALARLNRQPIKKRTVDSNLMVRKCLDELSGEYDGRHMQFIIGELAPCHAEPTLLEQVWTNLLANAIKYTRRCDVTTIEVGCRGPDDPGGELTYFVRDNGVGFDMRYVNKLFGVFQRLHRADDFEGSGIGLATVQRIVHRHGGRVWAEAQPNQGATFSFTLGVTPHHGK